MEIIDIEKLQRCQEQLHHRKGHASYENGYDNISHYYSTEEKFKIGNDDDKNVGYGQAEYENGEDNFHYHYMSSEENKTSTNNDYIDKSGNTSIFPITSMINFKEVNDDCNSHYIDPSDENGNDINKGNEDEYSNVYDRNDEYINYDHKN